MCWCFIDYFDSLFVMFIKVFVLHTLLTVEDIYLLDVRVPVIDK